MSGELMGAFEKLWVALRARWCDNHDLNKYSGSNFDDFLAEEGILEEVSECAQKR